MSDCVLNTLLLILGVKSKLLMYVYMYYILLYKTSIIITLNVCMLYNLF